MYKNLINNIVFQSINNVKQRFSIKSINYFTYHTSSHLNNYNIKNNDHNDHQANFGSSRSRTNEQQSVNLRSSAESKDFFNTDELPQEKKLELIKKEVFLLRDLGETFVPNEITDEDFDYLLNSNSRNQLYKDLKYFFF